MRYVVNQTELVTIAMSSDLVDKMLDHIQHDKSDSEDQKMFRVKNIVSFEEIKDNAILEKAD
jgi:hypothetical protein